ncbi:hypothetical protein HPB48_000087 [Haemaphysalis longicornis]|uniref:THAP-type domain-containing protein n=1 Tax=Haemaphysalis longicornis TaxID=44386 RepID=A0A9J6F6T3_HAELO|nr:hypothetical protein HPB48_000087 [Haemaphysalis longicornis]
MVVSCCAVGCTKRATKGSGIGFFRFPKEIGRRKAWVQAVRRERWQPSDSSRICGLHFINGAPSPFPDHPDWAPSVFAFKKADPAVLTKKCDRFERSLKRKRVSDDAAPCDSAEDLQFPQPGSPGPPRHTGVLSNNHQLHMQEKYVKKCLEYNALQEKVTALEKELEDLRAKGSFGDEDAAPWGYAKIAGNSDKVAYYTGLPNEETFRWVVSLYKNSCCSVETEASHSTGKGSRASGEFAPL